jgi:Tol biopolymer transport system component/DNA-binding winged helix-turn-helix (wHTH) protein
MEKIRQPFHLNGIEVIPDAGLIRSDAGEQRLPARLMKLLCLLAEAQGATVDRETLVEKLWPGGFINEEALSRSVADLRRFLGDDARRPAFIETIPKRGYRLVCAISEEAPGKSVVQGRPGRWLVIAAIVLTLGSLVYFNHGSQSTQIDTALLASATRLTADSVSKHHPELSPDGLWMAFIRYENGGGGLFVMPTNSPTDTRAIPIDKSVWSPVFDPSSAKLAVASLVNGECQVLELSINAGTTRPLGPCVLPNVSPILDWSSDGSSLAYVDQAPESGSAAIWQMRLSDGLRTQLTTPPDAYSYDTRPRYSPDGKTLSFSRGSRASRDIWLLDISNVAEGQVPEPRRLSFDNQFTISHDWLADGTGLILDSDRSGFRALWELDLNGNWHLLGARDAESPTLAGNQLAFKISQYESNIWPMDAATGLLSEQALISSTKYDTNPAWSPDGSEFAFSSNRTGRGSIWIAAADGSRERMVFEPQSGRSVWPVWSPDSSYLVATLYAESGQNLVRIALNHREVELIQTSGTRPYAGTFSADGRWFYYVASAGAGGTRLWRQEASTGENARILLDKPVNNFHIVSGQWILYTKHDLPGLFRAPIDDPESEAVLVEDLPSSAWAHWTTRGGWVYFPEQTDSGSYFLARMPIDGGEIEKVSDQYSTALGPNLAVHPEEAVILISRTDRRQSDIFLVDLEKD